MKTKPISTAAAVIVSLTAWLAACVPADSSTEAGLEAQVEAAAEAADGGPPSGAIQLSEDSYAVPVAVDSDGCEQFSEWSTRGAARQIVYFHDGSGGFTAIKSAKHSCSADMVVVGEDSRGCTLYRAEQPDGSVTGVDYYRSAGGYTANPDTADCAG